MHEAEIARQDSWVETEATIISCKPRVFSLAGDAVPIFAQDIPAPEYTVTFRYVVAHRAFTGRYRTQSEQEVGTTLTIAYDPLRPGRNTGADLSQNVPLRLIAWSIGIGLLALASWLGIDNILRE